MHYSYHRRSLLALAALPLAAGAAQASDAVLDKPAENDNLSVTDLYGKTLRVLTPGMMVTMEYSPDRANIEMDAQGRIVRIFIG
jgi:hypothetical protein